MARKLTAAEVAIFDQGMAQAGEEYEHLLELMRRSAAEQGSTGALCDTAAHIVRAHDSKSVLALLLAALVRDSEDAARHDKTL